MKTHTERLLHRIAAAILRQQRYRRLRASLWESAVLETETRGCCT